MDNYDFRENILENGSFCGEILQKQGKFFKKRSGSRKNSRDPFIARGTSYYLLDVDEDAGELRVELARPARGEARVLGLSGAPPRIVGVAAVFSPEGEFPEDDFSPAGVRDHEVEPVVDVAAAPEDGRSLLLRSDTPHLHGDVDPLLPLRELDELAEGLRSSPKEPEDAHTALLVERCSDPMSKLYQ